MPTGVRIATQQVTTSQTKRDNAMQGCTVDAGYIKIA